MLTNQLNTRPAPLLTPIYAKKAKREQKTTATTGKPFFDVYLKMLGALPANARPYNEREEVYRSEDAADIAEVRIAALITLGRPFIPAASMAITKGDLAAVESSKSRFGLSEGTKRPIMKVPTR